MNIRVENSTLIFENDFWKTINEHLINSVEREEYEYWKSLSKQAKEVGIDFAEETYLEDIKNGGDEPWHLTQME